MDVHAIELAKVNLNLIVFTCYMNMIYYLNAFFEM